jgi:hypothetical protein
MTVISDLTEKDLRWLKYLKIMTLCICDILKIVWNAAGTRMHLLTIDNS